jgi:hypothetical protein
MQATEWEMDCEKSRNITSCFFPLLESSYPLSIGVEGHFPWISTGIMAHSALILVNICHHYLKVIFF